jgi:PRTRC genetic system protein E
MGTIRIQPRVSFSQEGVSMFKELGPLLRQRTVVMILTRLEDDIIRVNVIPRKLNESENDALTTPLSVAGTAEDLEAELPSTLVQFVGAHLELKNTLETAKEQIAAAAKTAKAEARSKTSSKTATAEAEPAATVTRKPAEIAPKPAEPRKPEPVRNASLFDIGPDPESAPLSTSDEEEEILAEATEDELADEADDLDEAA